MMTANGTSPTAATARVDELRRQHGINPEKDEPTKLDAKVLGRSISANSDAEERQRKIAEGKRLDLIATRMRNAGIPRRHDQARVLHGEKWQEKQTRIGELSNTGFLVALIGDRGRGKTQMGVETIRDYIKADRGSARYVKAMDFFMAIRQTYGKGGGQTENDVVNDFIKPGLLVIDAMEVRSETAWEDRLLNHLIDRRYDECKDTLLIGNIAKDEITSALGHSIASRAGETGGVIVCDWESYRGAK